MEIDVKPSIYLETSIPSYLTARPSNDLRVAANQCTTIEWWDNRRNHFDLFISELVLTEASSGDPLAAQRRLEILIDLPKLLITDDVRILVQSLISQGSVPAKAEMDAYHIAVSAVNGIDYLLTWNCSHLANALIRHKIEKVCLQQDYESPIICTSQELMEG